MHKGWTWDGEISVELMLRKKTGFARTRLLNAKRTGEDARPFKFLADDREPTTESRRPTTDD